MLCIASRQNKTFKHQYSNYVYTILTHVSTKLLTRSIAAVRTRTRENVKAQLGMPQPRQSRAWPPNTEFTTQQRASCASTHVDTNLLAGTITICLLHESLLHLREDN